MSSTSTPLAEISASHLSMQIIGALLLVVITLFLIKIVIQRSRSLGGRRQGRSLSVVETLILGPRERLLVVQVDTKKIVVGVTAQSINHLYTLPETSSDTSDPVQATAPVSFRQRFSQICAGKVEQ